jgi:hypothetical protein
MQHYIEECKAMNQIGGSCWAYATAAVACCNMKKIYKREGGYPTFVEIKDKLLSDNGEDEISRLSQGGNPMEAFHKSLTGFRLKAKMVTYEEAVDLTDRGWIVVYCYYLSRPAW